MIELFITFCSTVWTHSLTAVQAAVFEWAVLPLMRSAGLMAYSEAAFDGVEVCLLGLLEMAVLWLILRPMEQRWPAQRGQSLQERRTDVLYTALHRLGGFALLTFAILDPLLDTLEGELRLLGVVRWQLDSAAWLAAHPARLFAAYVVVLDFADYWIHRAQHRVHAWWQLHALHHANTSMNMWSDNRNHILDDLLRDALMAVLAWVIGVGPGQFMLWVALSRMLQSVQHANVRCAFSPRWAGLTWLGERLLVGPAFHRTHHAIGSGYEGRAMGCNFGVVLPWWDLLFRTAKYGAALEATGVRDALAGRNYGKGFWAQQRLGLLRLVNKA